MCNTTMGMKNMQQNDMKRIRDGRTCSNCTDHEETEDFSDCLCICVLDGLEKGRNSVCKKWR